MRLQLTTDHSASSYGVPVFVRGRELLDYAPGIRALRETLALTQRELAERCGVSRRTAEGWEQGRMPSVQALYAMRALL